MKGEWSTDEVLFMKPEGAQVSVKINGGTRIMTQARILLVEGDANHDGMLSAVLKQDGYTINSCADNSCADGLQAQIRASSEVFDLIILDSMLPSRSGFEVCRHIRKNAVNTPILMLGTRELHHKIEGFKAGGDDYLPKPFEIPELQARVEALLRRVEKLPRCPIKEFESNGVRIDFDDSALLRDGKRTPLRKRECALLRYLVEKRGRVICRDELLTAVWGNTPLRTRTVDVHILWLRQKIERDPQNPQYIITVHGEGYRFAENEFRN